MSTVNVQPVSLTTICSCGYEHEIGIVSIVSTLNILLQFYDS